MNLRIEGNTLFIDTDQELTEPYLKKCKTGYIAYWHFIRDFHSLYSQSYTPSEEFKKELKARVDEVNAAKALLNSEVDVPEYSKFFAGEYEQYPFQIKAVRFIEKQMRVLLADDVGLGKTIIALTAILALIEKQNLMKFMVTVPASLRYQWLSESRKFIAQDMFPDLELVINNKTQAERNWVYKNFRETDNPIIMITSYDLIRRDAEKLKDFPADMIVWDEATKLKTRTTKINKAVRRLFKHVKYQLAMTATPIENGFEDLYCISEILDPRRLHSKTYFESQYCVMTKKTIWKPRRIDLWKVSGYKNISDAQEKLTGMYIRRTVDDVDLELPDIIRQNIELELTKDQTRMYQEVSGSIFGDMTRDDILGKMVYLLELCDSTELLDPSKRSSVKLDEIKRLLDEDFKYSKVILITQFKKFAKILERELKKIKPLIITGDTPMQDREFIVKEFNQRMDARVLIGTGAIQEGLNLQVASVLVNVDLPWNPAKLHQRIGRLHRISSEHKTIRIVNLMTQDTIEQHVMDTLYEKGELFEKMFRRDADVKIGSLLEMSREGLLDMVKV